IEVAALVGQSGIHPFWLGVGIVLALLLLAFLAGLAAGTAVGSALVGGVGRVGLNPGPGDSVIQGAAAGAANNGAQIDASERKKAVLVRREGVWQIGFVTEELSEHIVAVYVPNAPSANSGTLIFASPDRIVNTGMSISEALACLSRLGSRTPK